MTENDYKKITYFCEIVVPDNFNKPETDFNLPIGF